jgi:uncharacterized protein involved in exopolysaccharide biosynthesis
VTTRLSADKDSLQDSPRTLGGCTLGEALGALGSHVKLLVSVPLSAGLLALGATYLQAPVFTARTTIVPPQQSQGGMATALASLGALGGLAGNLASSVNPAERYVSLMQSATVADRIIDDFKLMVVYEAEFRADARKELAANARIGLSKKDGLITVEFDDVSPKRAAEVANRYVEELRRLTGALALTEAQQRRAFFERHLQQTRDRLATAQIALESSGFNPGALKAEPRAAAEAYARLKAETTAAELRLGLLSSNFTSDTPEVRQQQAVVAGLRDQLARAERAGPPKNDSDYVGRYREYKYQEVLFDVYARQFELARADESRESMLIQVIDAATPPERKSRPRRALTAVAVTAACALVLALFVVLRRAARGY